MPAAPYMNDNPYRLLGIGSAATQTQLQEAVDLADQMVKVDLPPASGLKQIFGVGMLPDCLGKVQTLGADPEERTLYRMFWPFDYQPRQGFQGTLADLLQSDVPGPAPSLHILQLRFVIRWVEYLVQPSWQKMQGVLDAFDDLCKDTQLYDFLAELLVKDGLEPDQAKQVGYHAPGVVLERMLVVFSRQGAQWWASGDIAAATALVESLSASAFDESIIDKILADLVACGEQEAARVQALIQDYQGWTPIQPLYQPTEVAKLRLLAIAMKSRVPAAQRWLQVVEDRIRQVALVMRNQALELANRQNEYEMAVGIVAHIQILPLPEDLVQLMRDTEAQLQNLIEERDKEIWSGITRISINPSLATINGVGGKIYGRTPFAGDPTWYFTTYYFVVLFLPIFPIRRYLVSDAPSGGWYFHASAPLTKFGRYHLATSLVLTCLFIGSLVMASQHPTRSYQGSPASRYASGKDGSASSGTTGVDSAWEERKQLQADGEQLQAELTALDTSIEHRRPKLESTANQLLADKAKIDKHNQSARAAFDSRLDVYEKANQQFEADVQTYNQKVRKLNAIVDRLDALKQEHSP